MPEYQLLGARILFVVGDSHVAAYAPLLDQVRMRTGLQVTALWQGGCAVAKPAMQMPPGCTEFLERAMGRVLRDAKPGDLLFLPGLRNPRIADQWTSERPADVIARDMQPQAIEDRIAARHQAMAWTELALSHGLRIVLEAPKPVLAAPVYRCVDWFNRANPVCAQGLVIDRATLLPLLTPYRNLLASLVRPGILLWDPFERLCPRDQCSAFDGDGRPIFFDADHLSNHGNSILVDDFIHAIVRVSRDR